jgi:plastocyanin
LVGSAYAQGSKGRGNHYGNGNAIGKFLNEEAMFKESPVWDTGIADRTGDSEVGVLFGGMTDINLPFPDAPDMGPWGMDPRAVEVSPGTDVTWTWYDGPGAIDAHHLVSFFDPPYEDDFALPWESPGHGHEHPGDDNEFYVHEDLGDSFTYTFEETGIYLYFCIPHGTPFTLVHPGFPELGEVRNLFGQRGAVIVSDE